jgi:hypothetical protein
MQFFGKKKWVPTSLNFFGYQSLRYSLAHLFRNTLKKGQSNEYNELKQTGLVIVENFLGSSEAQKIRKLKTIINHKDYDIGDYSEIHDNATIVKRRTIKFGGMSISAEADLLNYAIDAIVNKVSEVFSVEKVKCIENQNFWFDHIEAHPGNSSQSESHTDTYFPNYKVWYFPEEVKSCDIPLTIFMGSNKFSIRRMFFEYRQSISTQLGDELSWRPRDTFGLKLLKSEKKVCCKADTLVIADVHAFHKRSSSKKFCDRIQLHATLTREPFSRSTP